MIDIYFVRHGQADGNLAKRYQAEHTKLTPEGREQVALTAAWAKTIDPTHLISSRHVRTLQTAEIIGSALNMIPTGEDVFIELKRPDAIYGHRHKSARSMLYLVRWYLGLAGDHGRDGKGESYEAFRQRLGTAQAYLQALPDGSRVVVVSHAVFIGFMAQHLCDKGPASILEAFRLFRIMLRLRNGSYTHVQYNPEAGANTCAWTLVSYNNQAHLET